MELEFNWLAWKNSGKFCVTIVNEKKARYKITTKHTYTTPQTLNIHYLCKSWWAGGSILCFIFFSVFQMLYSEGTLFQESDKNKMLFNSWNWIELAEPQLPQKWGWSSCLATSCPSLGLLFDSPHCLIPSTLYLPSTDLPTTSYFQKPLEKFQ